MDHVAYHYLAAGHGLVTCRLRMAGPVDACQRKKLWDVVVNDDAEHGAIGETGCEVMHVHSVVLSEQLAPLQKQIKTAVILLAGYNVIGRNKSKQ